MMPHAAFEFVSANYDMSGSPLASFVRPYVIRTVGDLRIGIFGLGISFENLVMPELHRGITYSDPVSTSQQVVNTLRKAGCGLVICLSHLGYRYRSGRISDTILATEVPGIDLILGGHSHTFMDRPDIFERPDGSISMVNQVGWAGIRLGRIDVTWDRNGRIDDWYSETYPVDKRLDLA
jgi:5'-nucleotidase